MDKVIQKYWVIAFVCICIGGVVGAAIGNSVGRSHAFHQSAIAHARAITKVRQLGFRDGARFQMNSDMERFTAFTDHLEKQFHREIRACHAK